MQKIRNKMKSRNLISIMFIIFLITPIIGNIFTFTNLVSNKDQNENLNDFRLKISGDNINITTPDNRTYTTPMSGYYPASYGFENDGDGSDPYGWIIYETGLQEVDVISNHNGHNEVMRLFDTQSGDADYASARKSFLPQTTGSIEFWYLTSGYQESSVIRTWDTYDSTVGMSFRSYLGNFEYKIGPDNWIIIDTCNSDQWYHVKFDFDCTSDTYDIYIDGVLILNDGVFNEQVTSITILEFMTRKWGTSDDFYMYIDAIGLSWDPGYTIGDNMNEGLLLSYENSTVLDWTGYSLDGATNITIQGNTTIPMPTEEGLHSIQVFGNETSGTMHASDIRYFTIKAINIITPENRTYTAPMSGYYPATYGFESVNNGSRHADWTNLSGPNCSVQVIGEIDGHQKVMELQDDSTSQMAYCRNNLISSQTNGTIEMWMRTTDASKRTIFTVGGGIDGLFQFEIDNNQFRYWDGSFHDIGCAMTSNQWYNVSLHVECSTGGYQGLGQYSWKAGINGTEYGPFPFYMNYDTFSYIIIKSIALDSAYSTYFDAIGYSWDYNYNIGDFLINNTGYFNGTYSFENTENGKNHPDWSDIGPDCSVYIVQEFDGHQKVMELSDNSPSEMAFCRNNLISTQTNGTIEMWMRTSDASKRTIFTVGESVDGIFQFEIDNNQFRYWDGSFHDIGCAMTSNQWYHVVLHIECSTGGYQGLGQYSWKVVINRTEYGPFPFYVNYDTFSYIIIKSIALDSAYSTYFDAIGYSWDSNYKLSENENEGLLLSFETLMTPVWLGYSLDGAVNITIQGNTTIPMPDDGHHIIQVSGNSPGGMYYQSDLRHFTVKNGSISIKTPENITYTTPMSGYYPATHGFENAEDGSDPYGWTDSNEAGCSAQIIPELWGHKKVLELYDNSIPNDVWITNLFNEIRTTDGDTIEFWWRTSDSSKVSDVRLYNSLQTNIGVDLYQHSNGYYQYWDGVDWYNLAPCLSNVWYHHKIVVSFSTSTFDWYIDGELLGSNLQLFTSDLAAFVFTSSNVYSGYTNYLDAIGYSWDSNYNIGDNMNEGLLLSYENSTVLDWTGYSLDGATNITIQGNTTIPMPTGNGLHSIQVFGTTPDGFTIQSDKRYFSLDWEYISLRSGLSILDMIEECGLYIEISLNAIGFLHVSNFSYTIPFITDLGYDTFTTYIYNIDLYGANLVEDISILSSITIRFYYDPVNVNNPSDLKLYHYVSSLGQLRLEEFTINLDQNYVEFTTSELSYFLLTEIEIPITPFPWFIIIIIIILSVIGISIPSSYVIISRRKKHKGDKYKSLRKSEPHVKELPSLQDEELPPAKRVKPQITPDMLTPIKPRESKLIIKIKKAKKTKIDDPKINEIVLSEKEIEEVKKTEKEMRILDQEDYCQVHKGPLTGMTYICPKCKAKYCVKCATSLSHRNEGCWVCDTVIKLDSSKKESKPQNKKLQPLKPLDNNKLKQIFKSKNIIETIEKVGDINITLLDKEFLKKVDQFKWEENEKIEFIREMIALPPAKREKILNRMIKLSKYKED